MRLSAVKSSTGITGILPQAVPELAQLAVQPGALGGWLQTLLANPTLRTIDWQLARQLLDYSAAADSAVITAEQRQALVMASALVSWALGRGQVCLPLDHPPPLGWQTLQANVWPVAEQWLHWLQQLDCVWLLETGTGDAVYPNGAYRGQPLVLESRLLEGPGATGGQRRYRLYLARYYFYQAGLEQLVKQRLSVDLELPLEQLVPVFDQLFPERNDGSGWQAAAAATACLQGFCVITGGPGTGKTTTVTRLLSALLSIQPDMRIALAAPTGKAAARMTESIRSARSKGGLPNGDLIPEQSFTLHRLLGWRPDGFRYSARHRLPYDCVVVDESSMIDLAMMYQLVSALAPKARLILLGDRDQLASVEAGSVLADLCNAGQYFQPQPVYGQWVATLCGFDPVSAGWTGSGCSQIGSKAVQQPATLDLFAEPEAASTETTSTARQWPAQPPQASIANAVAELRVSHRFHKDSGIGKLAASVNAGQLQQSLTILAKADDLAVQWLGDSDTHGPGRLWETDLLAGYQDYCAAITSADAGAMLAALGRFQVLVAVRQGPFGAELVNRQIENLLTRHGRLKRASDSFWYVGRPVMVSRNDYDLGLFNGDIGVTVRDAQGELRVAFPATDGQIRYLLPSRLPAHETSFAMTVHKSQGSEFDQVLLLLPSQWQSVITRELIYTAITRARSGFVVLTSLRCWQLGLETRVERASGLRDALWQTGI
ncbi:exodeoxyribonuclease V subunit alpha [Oceanobacter mangrovi]|uniref:exodeoxyribonuclease V subunit alpha n=1 Tax=Oceanobacter mangrovi TaxID=2862510 RepID=UPI001C8EB0BF|nr:exodeoxyribonuclease V subunit alpha [Oceanobacter mangrovi]